MRDLPLKKNAKASLLKAMIEVSNSLGVGSHTRENMKLKFGPQRVKVAYGVTVGVLQYLPRYLGTWYVLHINLGCTQTRTISSYCFIPIKNISHHIFVSRFAEALLLYGCSSDTKYSTSKQYSNVPTCNLRSPTDASYSSGNASRLAIHLANLFCFCPWIQ